MPAGQKFPWILDWRGLPGRAPGAAEVLSLVSGLWPPVLNETKLRENATNNPGQRCICSKHGFHPEGMSVPGDLGWQDSNTMLSMYAAYGTLGQQVR